MSSRARLALFSVAGLGIFALGLFWRAKLLARRLDVASHDGAVFVAASSIAGFALLLALLPSRRRLAGALGLLLLLSTRVLEAPRLYETFPSRLFYPLDLPELKALPRSREPYRVVGVSYSMVPNQSALWELEDPRGYEAMTNARYFETYPLWCARQPVWFNRVDDLTRPFLSFLNVRFALGEPTQKVPAGWREFARGKHCAIFENPAALPRAFAPDSIRFVSPLDDVVAEMNGCRDFSKIAWIEAPGEHAREQSNGRVSIRIARTGPNLRLDVTAASAAWIVVSQTAWKGWQATIDERPSPLYFANRAFLAFRVLPGRHSVRLAYWPRSFSTGLAISGISLAAVAAAAVARRRCTSRRLR